MRTVSVWALFILYVALIIFVSTTFLPAEEPVEEEVTPPVTPPTNGSGGGGGGTPTPPKEPKEPFILLRPVYFFREQIPNFNFYTNVGLYLLFGVLCFLAVATSPRFDHRSILVLTMLSGLVLSISMETYQTTLSSRIADPNDVLYNVMGAMLGATLVFMVFLKIKAKKTKPSS